MKSCDKRFVPAKVTAILKKLPAAQFITHWKVSITRASANAADSAGLRQVTSYLEQEVGESVAQNRAYVEWSYEWK